MSKNQIETAQNATQTIDSEQLVTATGGYCGPQGCWGRPAAYGPPPWAYRGGWGPGPAAYYRRWWR